jgi:hypothetical protein
VQHQVRGRTGTDGSQPLDIDFGLAYQIDAVGGADRYCQCIHSSLGDKARGLVGIGVQLDILIGLDLVGGADPAELGLDRDTAGMRVAGYFARSSDILGQR